MNRHELITFIEQDPQLSPIFKQMKEQMQDDAAHDWHHLLRVASWALRLLPDSSANSPDLERNAVAAALMHDMVNLPKNSPDRARASQLAAEKARPILASLHYTEEAIRMICDAIEDHSFSKGNTPRSDVGRALQDADRLEALGTIGVFRLISTGVRMNARYFDSNDPWAKKRDLNDMQYSVDHCFTKLLKLPQTFRTEKGKAEARVRAKVILDMLRSLENELGEPMNERILAEILP